ncbi:MAG: DinB family protein [Bacteroidota bacterium]|nr:DinB family protein [Bacteroidota bacterium]
MKVSIFYIYIDSDIMKRTKWTDRKFTFDFPEGWMPDILERLRGTPPRLYAITKDLSEQQLQFKPDGKWSIKQHIGHLCDLEELHEGRIDDFIAGKEILRAADMSNAKTNTAGHDQKDISILLTNFVHKRTIFVQRLENLEDNIQLSKAIHPRLNVSMRPVDVAYFTAEHDDHHLADIREILNLLMKN